MLEVWVTAPPIEDAANRAVLEAVARELGVRRSAVTLRSGARSRTKVIEVQGLDGPAPANSNRLTRR